MFLVKGLGVTVQASKCLCDEHSGGALRVMEMKNSFSVYYGEYVSCKCNKYWINQLILLEQFHVALNYVIHEIFILPEKL